MLPNIKENLHAAEILVVLGEKARPALPAIKQAIDKSQGLQDHGWYMREALQFLVGQLDG